MIITTTQLNTISALQERKYVDMLVSEVKLRFPEGLPNDNDLHSEVHKWVNEARSFEFSFEDDIEQYVYIKYLYPRFKKLPYSADLLQILTYPDRNPEIKIDELINYFENQSHGQ
jgi:hypothetical protein